MEFCLILEDWLLRKGDFPCLCEKIIPHCENGDCPKTFHLPDGDGSSAKFPDLLKFLSGIGYAGECLVAMRLEDEDEPPSETAGYRLYFIRKDGRFHDRASDILQRFWPMPQFPFPECPIAHPRSARYG